MRYYQELGWIEGVARRINEDQEMAAVGDHCTVRFSVVFGDVRFDLHLEKGKVVGVVQGRKLDDRVDFGFRAPVRVWDQHLHPTPEAFYQNIYSMLMREPEFHLDGDGLVFAQNARAMQRIMAIFQEQSQ
ncbi:MAG: hypothetical protein VYD64_10650 [Pseudomonadota bacterium]|nr:hypothetical protein [Pseudomonadota bacterium]